MPDARSNKFFKFIFHLKTLDITQGHHHARDDITRVMKEAVRLGDRRVIPRIGSSHPHDLAWLGPTRLDFTSEPTSYTSPSTYCLLPPTSSSTTSSRTSYLLSPLLLNLTSWTTTSSYTGGEPRSKCERPAPPVPPMPPMYASVSREPDVAQ